ncbi:hypothetical protein tb265_11210 [Gemmatimonadetes bacterium T265]|nr:hypothetical protein tb265_11210 [Gemmatimonadetes bacterium T265]
MPNAEPGVDRDAACAFCRIAAGEAPAHVVWADAEHVAFLDRAPITPGHVVLVPRRHVPDVADLDADAHARLFARVRALAGPVAAAAGAPRAGIAVEGFGVDHAHVHLVPVWRGGDLDPCRQAPAGDDALRAAAARLRAALATPAGEHTAPPRMRDALVLPPQPELRTWRLCLTAFRPGDAPAVYAYASDPEVARYVTWPPSRSVAESAAFIRGAVGQADTHVWAVREGTTSAPAVGAVEFSLDTPERGAVHYVLARPSWGRGLATEAVRAVLGWAFGALPDLADVRTTVAAANAASRRVLEKCGFRHVGPETARWPKSPEPVALGVYALARDAWPHAPVDA